MAPMSYREGRFWQPDVTVATVVVHDGRLLCVEEEANGRGLVINQPAGHLEPDESLPDAALRETLEETGWDVRLTAFVGAYQWKAPETLRHYLRFARQQRAVTPGQSVVLYQGDTCLGGAVIASTDAPLAAPLATRQQPAKEHAA